MRKPPIEHGKCLSCPRELSMKKIRKAFIRLAYDNPEIRAKVLPVVRSAAWEKLPRGWTQDSVEQFWDTLTGDVKHKVTKCIKRMEGKFDDPGAFCASLADQVDPGWRSRSARSMMAGDGRRVLSELFMGHQPYVKNWDRFLAEIATMAPLWVDLMEYPIIDYGGISDFSFKFYERRFVVGETRGSFDSPPADIWVDVDAVDTVYCTHSDVLPFRKFAKKLLSWKNHIKDFEGFSRATEDMLNSQSAVTKLSKILLAYWYKALEKESKEDLNAFNLNGEIVDAANSETRGGDAIYEIEGIKVSNPTMRFVPEGVEFSLLVTADLSLEDYKPNYGY
jgi:hypothetical protein